MAYENVTQPGRKQPGFRTFPDGAVKIKDKNGFAVVYWKEENGKFITKGFCGTSCNADFYEYTRKRENAEKRVREYFENIAAHKALVAKRREEANAGHTLKVGDIITNSWGYDQTNVDWYRITKTSHSFVWLQRISAQMTDERSGHDSGYFVANINTEGEDPSKWGFTDLTKYPVEKHKASGQSVTMQFGCGSKWHGEAVYTSWYH
jgi:hypothetical protein